MSRRRSTRLQEVELQDETSTITKRIQANTKNQPNARPKKKAKASRDCQEKDWGPAKRVGDDSGMDKEEESVDKGLLNVILNDMPPEILEEIFAHLGPDDILRLARLNSVLRELLMSKSARPIWHTSYQNFVSTIPPLPSDLNEPQYAELLFGDGCSTTMLQTLYEEQVYRLGDAFDERLPRHLQRLDFVCTKLQRNLCHLGFPRRYKSVYPINWTFDLYREYRELPVDQRNVWLDEKKGVLRKMIEHENACQQWRDAWKTQRIKQDKEDRQKRRSDIYRRLAERGWNDRDFDDYRLTKHKLIDTPEPLTEDSWHEIRQTLEGDLQSYKDERLAKQRSSSLSSRYCSLVDEYERIRHTLFPGDGTKILPSTGEFLRLSTEIQTIDDLVWKTPFEQEIPHTEICGALETIDLRDVILDWRRKKDQELHDTLLEQGAPTRIDFGTTIFRLPKGPKEETARILPASQLFTDDLSASPYDYTLIRWERAGYNPFRSLERKPCIPLKDAGVLYDHQASWYARQMTKLCDVKSIRDVKKLNPIFECVSCSKYTEEYESGLGLGLGRLRTFMRWKQALTHGHPNHDMSIRSVDDKTKKRVEENETRMSKFWQTTPGMYPPPYVTMFRA
ncbi:hypothetical protein V5O48_006426 [Marasmius crinis-equi]|uniref:F-box domain-containing protein n=1 Tax=Marasmius crinis-equi TaxID=585013 RepID=A0ABR3FK40_9AGAR